MIHVEYRTKCYDWGEIHPETGELLSGLANPAVNSHPRFKEFLLQENPRIPPNWYADYVLYSHHIFGQTLMLRSNTGPAHSAILKAFQKLPLANFYEHAVQDGKRGDKLEIFESANYGIRKLYNYLRALS